MSISTTPLPGTIADPLYPGSDGKPMAETGIHVITIIELYTALQRHFADRPDVHLAADMFLYYEQGNPKARKAPDVMVTKGARGKHKRRSFRVWEEQAVPTVVFEITSKKTRREDAEGKPAVYAKVGIAEYFLFDPLGEYLRPRFQGFRLTLNGYEPLPADERGRILSRELDLTLVPQGDLLRLFDERRGELLPTLRELADRAADASQAILESRRALGAAKEADERAEAERHRAETERRRAEAERRRADALEQELKRLREQHGESGA